MSKMLSKLAIRNAKRSIKDYIIYLITITLSFSFIFAFNLISHAKEVINLCSVMENFQIAMYFVNFFIILVVCFLINYTTKFMFTKRSKEFGTYLVLGIKKKEITKMFTLENIFLGIIAFIISIPLGYIFSIFMSFIIKNIFSIPGTLFIDFNMTSCLLTLLYIGIIYLIILFLARHRIKKLKIHDLLYYEKRNEMKKTKKYHKFIFPFSLLLGVTSLFLFDLEFTEIAQDPSFTIVMLCILFLIISIYGCAFSLSEIVLNFVLNNKKRKYKKDNLFIARTYSSKIKTMSLTIGTITTLITLTLIALNLSSLFKGMFDYQLELLAPYDISIELEKDEVQKYLDIIKENYTIEDQFVYDSYKETNNNISKQLGNNGGWRTNDQVIKLSDYNRLLELKGNKPIELKDNEYLLHITKEFNKYLKNNPAINTITLPNQKKLNLKDVVNDGYTYAWGTGYGLAIIVPDHAVSNLEKEETHLIVNTKEKTTEDFAQKLREATSNTICEENNLGYTTCYNTTDTTVRGKTEADNNGFITISSFICFYVALIFIAVVGAILAIQSLSDSTKFNYRYKVLNNLGVRENDLYKTIFKQNAIFFFTPLIIPTIISLSTLNSLNHLFKTVLSNDFKYLSYFFINLGLFLLIYLLYFIATYFGFKKNIQEKL